MQGRWGILNLERIEGIERRMEWVAEMRMDGVWMMGEVEL